MTNDDTPLVDLDEPARQADKPRRHNPVRPTESVGDPDAHDTAAAGHDGAAAGALLGTIVAGPLGTAAGAVIGGAAGAAGGAADGTAPDRRDQDRKEDQFEHKEDR